MTRRRLQTGSLQVHTRKDGIEIWQGRYWENATMPDGSVRRVRKKIVLGSKLEMPSEWLARRALQPYIDRANMSSAPTGMPKRKPPSTRSTNRKIMISFKTFADKWKKAILIHSKFSTQETDQYRLSKWLLPAFGNMFLRNIRGEAVQLFFNSLIGKISAKSMRNVRNVLASVLKHARAWEYISHDPLAGLKLPRYKPTKKKAYTAEHVAKIISGIHPKYRILLFFFAETGIRSGEAMIEIPDIDLVGRKITIRQAIWRGHTDTPKSAASIRTFHISNRLAKLLRKQIEDRHSGSAFASRTGTPLNMHNFRSRALAKARAAAGVTYGDLHAFRHFNATVMDSLRVPSAVRRLRLGHESESVMDGYIDVVEKDDQDTAERIAELIWNHLDPQLTLETFLTWTESTHK